MRIRFALMMFLCALTPALAPGIQWEFSNPAPPGQPPAGWSDASQAMTPPPTPPGPYQITTFDQESVLLFRTEANTGHRPKTRTDQTYETGVYTWRLYIPDMEDNAQVSAGAFLYSDQSGSAATAAREIDFEIGPGRASVRAGIPNLPEDALLAYLTVQPDNAPGRSGEPGSSLIFQPADPANHILPDNWYTLTLTLGEDAAGRYVVDWYIRRDGGPQIKARPTYTTRYGPSNAWPTNFRIYNSLENLAFMGDALPTRDHVIYFDMTSHTVADCSESGFETITDMEADTASGNFPPGSDREWTRFGAAYESLALTTNSADVDEGTVSLQATANFAAGTKYGLRYNLPAAIDMECVDRVRWRMKTDAPGDPVVQYGFQETDGDIWVSGNEFSPTNAWDTYEQSLAADDLVLADGSGGGDLDLLVEGIGFDLLANGGSSGASVFSFDLIESVTEGTGITSPAVPVLPLVTSMEPPDLTLQAFPPDPSSAAFPGTTLEGEWTRFGAAYGGVSLVANAAEAAHEDHYLNVIADWSAGARVGVRYLPYGQPADWSAWSTLRLSMRRNTADSGTTQEFALFEEDGDIWVGPQTPVPAVWSDFTVRLPEDLTLSAAGGDGVFDASAIVLFGWNFDNTSGAGSGSFDLDHVRLENPAAAVQDWMIVF